MPMSALSASAAGAAADPCEDPAPSGGLDGERRTLSTFALRLQVTAVELDQVLPRAKRPTPQTRSAA